MNINASDAQPMDLDIQGRLRFAKLDDGQRQLLRAVWPIILPELPGILDRFYTHLASVPHLTEMIGTRRPALISAQTRHWERLFTGNLGDDYAQAVVTIGRTHHRIGLKPQWYIAGYQFILCELIRCLASKARFSTSSLAQQTNAVVKVVLLDLDLSLSAYDQAMADEKEQIIQRTRELVGSFQSTAREIIAEVEENATLLKSSGASLSSTASDTMTQSHTVARATSSTAENIQSAAAASEELSASIREISQQLTGTVDIVQDAQAASETSAEVAGRLTQATENIGRIVDTIKKIAGQTNLLALNATIEAARAGDMGKGFAVVASEVKALANQTSAATDDVAKQIAEIQRISAAASEAAEVISTVMSQVGERTGSIAAAVEEQNAATQEIAGNMTRAAASTEELKDATHGVSDAVTSTGSIAGGVVDASGRFAATSQRLTTEIEAFLRSLWESVLDRRKGQDPSYRGPLRRETDGKRLTKAA